MIPATALVVFLAIPALAQNKGRIKHSACMKESGGNRHLKPCIPWKMYQPNTFTFSKDRFLYQDHRGQQEAV
ncbi:MAG: hypothetical protein D3917_00370 [Candidatus Electrothrix sp. AX5]|nr:hypothetical protein [Candidatus Electrothrix sp. AX5]